jgi:hypothetical protein
VAYGGTGPGRRRITLWIFAGVTVAVLLGLIVMTAVFLFIVWYWNHETQSPDMAAIASSQPVRQSDRQAAARIAADGAALTRAIPWLAPQGRFTTDACTPVYDDGGHWQCVRTVTYVSGVTATATASQAGLAGRLAAGGWVSRSVFSVAPGWSEQPATPGTGQAALPLSGVGSQHSDIAVTAFWASRPVSMATSGQVPAAADSAITHAVGRFRLVLILELTALYYRGTGTQVPTSPPAEPTVHCATDSYPCGG